MSTLTTIESLILAQAVWEHGTVWTAIANVLSKHPLISRPKSFFTAQSSQAMYKMLMQQAGIILTDACNTKRSASNYKLAEKFYRARLEELRDLIVAEETKFRVLVSEIEDIRAGKRISEVVAKPLDVAQTGLISKTPPCELFEGSDLSGITTTSPSASQEDITVQPEGADFSSIGNNVLQEGSSQFEKPPQVLVRVPDQTVDGEIKALNPSHRKEEEEEEIVEGREVDDAKAQEQTTGREEEEEEELRSPEIPEEQIEDEPIQPSSAVGVDEDLAQRSARRRSTGPSVHPVVRKSRRQQGESPLFPIKGETEDEAVHDNETHESSPAAEGELPVLDALGRRAASLIGKRKAFVVDDVDSPRVKRLRDDSEPVEEEETGANAQAPRGRRRTDEQLALKKFQHVIGMLHQQISQHRNGNIFHNPIKTSDAPDYHDIVKRPIDLKTIKMKVKDGIIVNSLEYQRDILLMFANALMYNRPGSDVYSMAEDMMLESETHILAFRQTEGLVKNANRG